MENFNVPFYTEKRINEDIYDRDITSFLMKEGYAVWKTTHPLIISTEKRLIQLTEKGIKLKDAGSYEAYQYNEIIRITTLERIQRVQERKMLDLTAILAFGSISLVAIEILKIFLDQDYKFLTPDLKSCLILLFFGIGIGITISGLVSELVKRKSK